MLRAGVADGKDHAAFTARGVADVGVRRQWRGRQKDVSLEAYVEGGAPAVVVVDLPVRLCGTGCGRTCRARDEQVAVASRVITEHVEAVHAGANAHLIAAALGDRRRDVGFSVVSGE